MKFNYIYKKGKFVERVNRFIAIVDIEGEVKKAHVPNTGRLKELLVKDATVYLSYHQGKSRKTDYSLRFVENNNYLVSIDSQLPNKLVKEGIKKGLIKIDYNEISTEVSFKNSRFDLMLHGKIDTYIEVKGVTLQKSGVGMFPDAPTSRGRRHIEELIHAVDQGYKAMIIFLIQYPDIKKFRPNDRMDLKFGDLLRKAAKKGVEIRAYNTIISKSEAIVKQRIKVELY